MASAKLQWGWAARNPAPQDTREYTQAMSQLTAAHTTGSKHLRNIFRGPFADGLYAAGKFQVMAAWRQAVQHEGFPAPWGRQRSWSMRIHGWLMRYGWAIVAPWRWNRRTPQGQVREVCLDSKSERWKGERGKKALLHELRESWRQTQFRQWQHHTRIDARLLRWEIYDERRCKIARRLGEESIHRRAVMVGASAPRPTGPRTRSIGGCWSETATGVDVARGATRSTRIGTTCAGLSGTSAATARPPSGRTAGTVGVAVGTR